MWRGTWVFGEQQMPFSKATGRCGPSFSGEVTEVVKANFQGFEEKWLRTLQYCNGVHEHIYTCSYDI